MRENVGDFQITNNCVSDESERLASSYDGTQNALVSTKPFVFTLFLSFLAKWPFLPRVPKCLPLSSAQRLKKKGLPKSSGAKSKDPQDANRSDVSNREFFPNFSLESGA
jgi:hypothetical protein